MYLMYLTTISAILNVIASSKTLKSSPVLFCSLSRRVYRLDKLQKSTGLDLRVFEDAITFKIALMVVKYMKYMESLDY